MISKNCSLCKEDKNIEEFYFERPNQRCARCKKCRTLVGSLWAKRNPDKVRKYRRVGYKKTREKIYKHYGSSCECCGESEQKFLSLDHTNGGGTLQRKELGIKSGDPFYRWIIKNKYPPGFRILCHNCNQAIGHWGVCPHKISS